MRVKTRSKYPVERENLIRDNPEKFYTFGEVIGSGKFSQVKKVTDKKTGKVYAAKCSKFDNDTLKFAVRELDVMTKLPDHKGIPKLHQAFIVRKYLILIMDLVEGDTILNHFHKKHSITEKDVADVIKQVCEILEKVNSVGIVHCDIRPTNIRMENGTVKLLDYNSALPVGSVVDVIGDTEFSAPETLSFDPILPGTDMWAVGVLAYTLASGASPFFKENEDSLIRAVSTVQYSFDAPLSSPMKQFIKKCLVRIPENRMRSSEALNDKFLTSNERVPDTQQDLIGETSDRLLSEESEEYVTGSFVFRTFEEEEYESPEEWSDDDDE